MAEALAQLRAIPQPEADRALLEEGYYEVLEQEIYTLREYAVAAAAGDIAREFLLGSERVHLTHQRNGFELAVRPSGVHGAARLSFTS